MVIFGLSFGFFRLYFLTGTLHSDVSNLRAKADKLQEEGEILSADLDYYKNDYNLEKEIRSRFNLVPKGVSALIISSK